MFKGIMMVLGALALIGAAFVLGGKKWEPRKVDLAHLPEDPTVFDCKHIARLYDKELEALAKAMSEAAFAPPAAGGTQFIKAGGFGTGVRSVSKADGTGFGGITARKSLLEKVDRYLQRKCSSAVSDPRG